METVKSRLVGNYTRATCPHCRTLVEYIAPTASSSSSSTSTEPSSTTFHVECAQCHEPWVVKSTASSTSSSTSGGRSKPSTTTAGRKARTIGTDEKPLDTSYYDLLGLPVTCTTEEVKKAYRRLAIKNHPDKNPNDPTAADRFKEIAIAYTTLSDPGLRHTYNEFGKSRADGGDRDGNQMVDPEAIFSTLFGGERFQDIIGTISLGSEMKSAMQEEHEDDDDDDNNNEGAAAAASVVNASANGQAAAAAAGGSSSSSTTSTATTTKSTKPTLTPEQAAIKEEKQRRKDEHERKVQTEKARVREQRVRQLAVKLRDKLALFSEQAVGEDDKQIADGVRTMWSIEAEELKKESYGVELLHTVGFVYESKSKHFLASTGPIPFGVGGWFHSARSTAHIFNQTVSTVRSAYALKDVFDAIQKAEESGVSADEKKKLEDKAAQMGLHALFKGAKLEVESVIREVCDRVLSPTGVEDSSSTTTTSTTTTTTTTTTSTTATPTGGGGGAAAAAAAKVSTSTLRKRAVALGILGEVFGSVVKDPGQESPLGPGFGI
ncbi:hypothetical protein JCM3766R1_004851 [Sporobolomyces carnicolor]